MWHLLYQKSCILNRFSRLESEIDYSSSGMGKLSPVLINTNQTLSFMVFKSSFYNTLILGWLPLPFLLGRMIRARESVLSAPNASMHFPFFLLDQMMNSRECPISSGGGWRCLLSDPTSNSFLPTYLSSYLTLWPQLCRWYHDFLKRLNSLKLWY